MLNIYRRHRRNCDHRRDGREYRRCRCPIWVDGTLGERRILKSLKTRDWTKALEISRQWELDNRESETSDAEPVTVATATEEFLADAAARGLNERTIYEYKFLFKQLCAFSDAEGVRFLTQLDVRLLRKFRTTWKDRNMAALKKLERLRAFYRFAVSNKWVESNLAKDLKRPFIEVRQTLPYEQEEMFRILAAAETRIAECQAASRDNARRLKALILLLRYSGLRIGDAVSCSVERVLDGKLRLYTQKTGTHVHCPLPPFVVKELDALPKRSERYWFWTGDCKLKTAVSDWQTRLLGLAKDAKVPNCMHTASATPLPSRTCSKAYHWSVSRFSSAIQASK